MKRLPKRFFKAVSLYCEMERGGRKEDIKRNNKIAKLELGTNEVSLDAMHSHTQKDGCMHFPPLPGRPR